jgi:hypothetical protein
MITTSDELDKLVELLLAFQETYIRRDTIDVDVIRATVPIIKYAYREYRSRVKFEDEMKIRELKEKRKEPVNFEEDGEDVS